MSNTKHKSTPGAGGEGFGVKFKFKIEDDVTDSEMTIAIRDLKKGI